MERVVRPHHFIRITITAAHRALGLSEERLSQLFEFVLAFVPNLPVGSALNGFHVLSIPAIRDGLATFRRRCFRNILRWRLMPIVLLPSFPLNASTCSCKFLRYITRPSGVSSSHRPPLMLSARPAETPSHHRPGISTRSPLSHAHGQWNSSVSPLQPAASWYLFCEQI